MSVFAVIFRESDAAPLTRWAWRFAQASEKDLIILSAQKGEKAARSKEVPLDDAQHPHRSDETLAKVFEVLEELGALTGQGSGDEAASEGIEVRKLEHADLFRGVMGEVERCSPRLLLLGGRSSGQGKPAGSGVGGRLFSRAPCTTLFLRLGASDGVDCQRILVPAAGGEHSLEALRWAGKCSDREGSAVVPLFVESDSGDVAREVGERILGRTISQAGLQGHSHLEERVELAGSVTDGIARVAQEGYDLILMGCPHGGALHQKLFKTVPDRLIAKQGGVTLGVIRAGQPVSGVWRRAAASLLDLSVPQLERDDRVALVENLQLQSRWSFDFMTLIGLSTAIASLGLLQDSAAVVIGAMLVAPLMTPLLGAGLALVQGNLPLMRTAAQSIILGFLSALAISAALGLLVPLPALSSELAARGQPTLLDLGVAFLSGLAAAYCVGRSNLSAALPGVAIAAALVPPIATIGISLALGDLDNARGSAMLFGVNVVAVILGAATSFFAAGIRSNRSLRRGSRWARAMIVGLALALIAFTVPLASFLVAQISPFPRARYEIQEGLRTELERRIAVEADARLVDLKQHQDGEQSVLVLSLAAPQPLTRSLAEDLFEISAKHLGAKVDVRVHTQLVRVIEASSSHSSPSSSSSPSSTEP